MLPVFGNLRHSSQVYIYTSLLCGGPDYCNIHPAFCHALCVYVKNYM